MACHGLTFSELVNKNIQVESDTGPVNPHVFLPHNDPNGEVTECTNCHQVHTMPLLKDIKTIRHPLRLAIHAIITTN